MFIDRYSMMCREEDAISNVNRNSITKKVQETNYIATHAIMSTHVHPQQKYLAYDRVRTVQSALFYYLPPPNNKPHSQLYSACLCVCFVTMLTAKDDNIP